MQAVDEPLNPRVVTRLGARELDRRGLDRRVVVDHGLGESQLPLEPRDPRIHLALLHTGMPLEAYAEAGRGPEEFLPGIEIEIGERGGNQAKIGQSPPQAIVLYAKAPQRGALRRSAQSQRHVQLDRS